MTMEFIIALLFVILCLLLIGYDRNKVLKNKHVVWISRNVIRDNSGVNESAARFHQAVLGFLFIFCVGIAVLSIIGLIEG